MRKQLFDISTVATLYPQASREGIPERVEALAGGDVAAISHVEIDGGGRLDRRNHTEQAENRSNDPEGGLLRHAYPIRVSDIPSVR